MTAVKNFRADINGLRAWAVTSVILFHFSVSGFQGGFVGVDIFFVISGYLMTGIMARSLEKNGKIHILDFWMARARRILPALIILCAFLIIIGWMILIPIDYKKLATQSVSALGFFSNILFWSQSGYFDTESHEKLLLHTWSLSVEWQYYIILPILFIILWRIRPDRKFINLAQIFLFVVSLVLSLLLSAYYPSSSFFMIHTRAWEFLAGGIIALSENKILLSLIARRVLSGVGFALIAFSVFIFSDKNVWPGYLATIPVLGASLIISSSVQNSIFISNKFIQRIGDWSYSLYLWHWPFASALFYLNMVGSIIPVIISIILTLAFGCASYRYVESVARYRLVKLPRLWEMASIAIAVLIVVLPSVFIRQTWGVPSRVSERVNQIIAEEAKRNPRMKECDGSIMTEPCLYGGNKPGVIVFGDSHAGALIRAVERHLPDKSLGVLDWTLSGCPPVRGITNGANPNVDCSAFVQKALDKAKELPSSIPIIIAGRFSVLFEGRNDFGMDLSKEENADFYIGKPRKTFDLSRKKEIEDSMIDTACNFAQTRDVYMLRPIPEMIYNVPTFMARPAMFGENSTLSIKTSDYLTRHADAIRIQDDIAKKCNIKIIDPLPYLCDSITCKGDFNNLPIYFDDDHLNETGADLIMEAFEPLLSSLK